MYYVLYGAGHCRPCRWLERLIPQQFADKMADLRTPLVAIPVAVWGKSVNGPEAVFRNKVKMAVNGSVERPLLGMLHRDGIPVDFTDCPLYPSSFAPAFAVLKPFVARTGLTSYNVTCKRGKLKYLLLTANQQGEMMPRSVLRSEIKLAQLRAVLPWLQTQLPQLKMITVNIQPVHTVIMEDKQRIFFTEQQALGEVFNKVSSWIRLQGLSQINPAVASRLYVTVCNWVRMLPVQYMWDLLCGVGGFGLHYMAPTMRLTGIEVAPEVIVYARQPAAQLGPSNLHLQTLDSAQFATHENDIPQLVSTNPPRRGIGAEPCDYLSRMASPYIIYSNCNARTMVTDIACLRGYRVERVQPSDMSPYTTHYEVLILLVREV